jgi:hypothetical protein
MTMKEIGGMLWVNESRVSRVRTPAVASTEPRCRLLNRVLSAYEHDCIPTV